MSVISVPTQDRLAQSRVGMLLASEVASAQFRFCGHQEMDILPTKDGVPISQIARHLGSDVKLLCHWQREAQRDGKALFQQNQRPHPIQHE